MIHFLVTQGYTLESVRAMTLTQLTFYARTATDALRAQAAAMKQRHK